MRPRFASPLCPSLQLSTCAAGVLHSERSLHHPALLTLVQWTSLVAAVTKAAAHHITDSVLQIFCRHQNLRTRRAGSHSRSLICSVSRVMRGPPWQPPRRAASSGRAEQVPRPPPSAAHRTNGTVIIRRRTKDEDFLPELSISFKVP